MILNTKDFLIPADIENQYFIEKESLFGGSLALLTTVVDKIEIAEQVYFLPSSFVFSLSHFLLTDSLLQANKNFVKWI